MSIITTDEIAVSVEKINQEINNVRALDRFKSKRLDQKKDESAILRVNPSCSISKVEELRQELGGLEPKQFKDDVNSQFYNPNIMKAASCVSEAIMYMTPVKEGPVPDNIRIRNWVRNLKQIGAQSVSGYAFQGKLLDSDPIFVIKAPRSVEEDDLQHETFVGLFGTNGLRSRIPNFAYIFGGFKCAPPVVDDATREVVSFCLNSKPENSISYVAYENITPSKSMNEYLRTCTGSEFVEKYLQVLFALKTAFEEIEFTHYDLHHENVMLRVLPEKKVIEYDSMFLLTDMVATIIDYGTSHFVFNGKHYGDHSYRLTYGVSGDRAFPLYDAYKLLLFCMSKMTNYEEIRDWKDFKIFNQPAFDEAVKILRFFNSTEDPLEILSLQYDYYYSAAWTPKTSKVTHDQIINHILEKCDTSKFLFRTKPDGYDLLQCGSTTEPCLTTTGILNRFGLNDKAEPRSFFEFYDLIGILQAKKNEEKLNRVIDNFNYQENLKVFKDEFILDLAYLTQEFDKLALFDIKDVEASLLLNPTNAKAVKESAVKLVELVDLYHQTNSGLWIWSVIAKIYEDKKSKEEIKHYGLQLLEIRQSLKEYIAVLDANRRRVRNLKIPAGLQRNPDIQWYLTGFQDLVRVL